MELIPRQTLEGIPFTGSVHGPMQDRVVYARLFDREANWQWLVLEREDDHSFSGIIVSPRLAVVGPFNTAELLAIEGASGAPSVFFDSGFVPQTVARLALSDSAISRLLADLQAREQAGAEPLVPLD